MINDTQRPLSLLVFLTSPHVALWYVDTIVTFLLSHHLTQWLYPNVSLQGPLGEEENIGKRKQNVGHYKPHSLSRGKKGDWKEEWYVPTIILHFFHSCFLSPAGHFTMCTSWHTDLPSPHHNQLSPSNVIGPRKFSCIPITTDTLDGLLGSLIWVT